MAHNEEMKRLLKDDKIVGQRFDCTLNEASEFVPQDAIALFVQNTNYNESDLVDIYSEDGEIWTFDIIIADSFEQGIKVDDDE